MNASLHTPQNSGFRENEQSLRGRKAIPRRSDEYPRDVNESLLGKVIAQRYRLISQLGSGAMSTVYLARHVVIERLCAIKVFRAQDTTFGADEESRGGASLDGSVASPSEAPTEHSASPLRDRFLREARAVNRIHHPNIVEITDYGDADGLVYLVMEYVPGEALSRLLAKGPLGWRASARIGVQIASALERAHEMGVIHRDLKPANVLVLPKKDGSHVVKLTDFGVAKMADEPRLTEAATLLGTPGYMAPEYQFFGRISGRSDLYSLGVLLFEATTGRLPDAPSGGVAAADPDPLAKPKTVRDFIPDVDPFFDDVVATLLATDPDDRPRDAFEACDLLERALAVTPRASSVGPTSRPSGAPGPLSDRTSGEPHEPATEVNVRRPGPRLLTAPYGRVLPICLTALERVRERGSALAAAAERTVLPPNVAKFVAHAEEQVTMVSRIARLVEADAQEENALRAEARSIHTDLGKKLDDAARERSKTLGWAGTVAERAYQVGSRLSLGEDPISTMEAMVWEHAALEAAEADAHEGAVNLALEIAQIQAEMAHQTERIEGEIATVAARLWGRVGALRSMALEAWMALEAAAQAVGLPIESLCDV